MKQKHESLGSQHNHSEVQETGTHVEEKKSDEILTDARRSRILKNLGIAGCLLTTSASAYAAQKFGLLDSSGMDNAEILTESVKIGGFSTLVASTAALYIPRIKKNRK